MTVVFYIAGAVAVLATLLVITRAQRGARAALPGRLAARRGGRLLHAGRAVRGRPRGDHLRRRHHGAVRLRRDAAQHRRADGRRRAPAAAAGSGRGLLAAVLLAELVWAIARRDGPGRRRAVGPREVGVALYGPYVLGVELASMLLALIGACIGRARIARPPQPAWPATRRRRRRCRRRAGGSPASRVDRPRRPSRRPRRRRAAPSAKDDG